MLVVLLWTILIFAKSPATATAAAAAAAAAAASAANKSNADSDEMSSTSGALIDANGTVVSAVCTV